MRSGMKGKPSGSVLEVLRATTFKASFPETSFHVAAWVNAHPLIVAKAAHIIVVLNFMPLISLRTHLGCNDILSDIGILGAEILK